MGNFRIKKVDVSVYMAQGGNGFNLAIPLREP